MVRNPHRPRMLHRKPISLGVTSLSLLLAQSSYSQAGKSPADPYAGVNLTVNPARGPVDLGLSDPALVGAIDVHEHLDPDAPGFGGTVRAIDVFDQAIMAKQHGMRGFVFKEHQDVGGAETAYLVRKHVDPAMEVFGRMASNFATGGINVAALEHFATIKGGWGRIYEMPTRDTCAPESHGTDMSQKFLAANRPWMLLMPPGSPSCVAISKDGQLLPEVKQLIDVMAKLRTIDSHGALVLATGHATNEEHLLLAQYGRSLGLNVLLTHPGDIPAVAPSIKLGAYVELLAATPHHYQDDQAKDDAASFVRKYGAEHIVVGSDCGQTANLYPTDCLAVMAKGLRSRGITEHELDLMYKINPAKLLGIAPPNLEEPPAPEKTKSH